MEITEERKEYLKEYRKSNLKRIPLDVNPQFYAAIKEEADSLGLSVNAFIRMTLYKAFMKK